MQWTRIFRGGLVSSMERIIAESEVRDTSRGRVRWIRTTGKDASSRVLPDGAVDFVFIDGDHSREGIAADWDAWSGGVSPGGIIALHDSASCPQRNIDDAGSVRFTQEVVARDQRYCLVETVDSLTVWRRIDKT